MSKKKKKVSNSPVQVLSPSNYIIKFGRSLNLEACYINEDWYQNGMANIVVIRSKKSKKKVVGVYLVDLYCRGLKDVFFRMDLPDFEIEDMISGIRSGNPLIEIVPDLAFNIIYGGIEYAEDLGISPHKDFGVCEYLLPPVEEVPYIDVIFGLNNRPTLFAGPTENISKVINSLNKTVGLGNYDFHLIDG